MRIMVFVVGVLTLNLVGGFVYCCMVACKSYWLEKAVGPFFCGAFTYFGIYGAIVLWSNEMIGLLSGTMAIGDVEQTPEMAKIRANITLETYNFMVE